MKFLLEAEAVEVERDFNSEDELTKQAWKDSYRKERIANKDKSGPELLKLKTAIENENYDGRRYEEMQGAERNDFILDVINSASNKDTLSKARLSVVNAIKNSDWDEKVIKYLSNLPNNIEVSNPIVELTTNLILDDKIDYEKSKDWLNNSSVYDRKENEALYTIKALALLDNDKLTTTSTGKLFKSDLTTDKLKDGNTFFNADKIKDILNAETNPEATIEKASSRSAGSGKREEIKKVLKDNNVQTSEAQVDKTIDTTEELVKEDLISALTGFGLDKKKATQLVADNYTNDKTFEDLLRDLLRGLGRGA